MCILLWTRLDDGTLVIANNRDEYFGRETALLQSWPGEGQEDEEKVIVYSGRDTSRPEGGTWIGVNSRGWFGCITNVRESQMSRGKVSRGLMLKEFLSRPWDSIAQFYEERVVNREDIGQVGGFNMVAYNDREGMYCLTNRGDVEPSALKLAMVQLDADEGGISNGLVAADSVWPKVQQGQVLLKTAVQSGTGKKDEFGDRVFDEVLCQDTFPRGGAITELAQSIFIPPLEVGEQYYGTRQQTIILLDSTSAIITQRDHQQSSMNQIKLYAPIKLT